jgi:hypothetical protein
VRIGAGRILKLFTRRLPIADATILVKAGIGPRLGVLRQWARLDIETQRAAMLTQIDR